MEWLIFFFFCVPVALLIYFLIVRPLLIPLSQRIPTGRAYKPTLGAKL